MRTQFIEATNGFNWGKFAVGDWDYEELERRSEVDTETTRGMIAGRGWALHHRLVFDLQTGEGALFLMGGSAHHDLEKRRIWVCPLFEPFLTWLYEQWPFIVGELPSTVHLPEAESALYGYRRPGPQED